MKPWLSSPAKSLQQTKKREALLSIATLDDQDTSWAAEALEYEFDFIEYV